MIRLVVVLAALAASACMRIYPDPELPDAVITWSECGDDGVTVRLDARAPDGTVVSADVPCAAGQGRLEDLDRAVHAITVTLLDAGGAVLGRAAPASLDLSAGFSRRLSLGLFARDSGFVALTWTFAGGQTCAGLGVEAVDVALVGELQTGTVGGWCEDGHLYEGAEVAAGRYRLRVLARRTSDFATVAASTEVEVVVPARGEQVDLGAHVLVPCAPDCPTPGDGSAPP